MKPALELGKFTLDFAQSEGFRLLSCNDIFSKDSFQLLQDAFHQVDWVKKETSFYTQFKAFVTPADQHALALFYDAAFFIPFKSKLEQMLKVSLRNEIRVIAHKLITADAIGIHNDYSDPEFGYENFRFIFQFAQPKQLVSGGELTFWASKYSDEIVKQYSYASNNGICFEITPRSFHSVTPVEGERHTVVMYLWEQGRNYDGSGIKVT